MSEHNCNKARILKRVCAQPSLIEFSNSYTNHINGLHSDFIVNAINNGARGSDHSKIDITTFTDMNSIIYSRPDNCLNHEEDSDDV